MSRPRRAIRSGLAASGCVGAVLAVSACGGKSADEVASNLDNAISAATYEERTLEFGGQQVVVREAESDSAAETATCQALGAYNSEAVGLFRESLEEYAARQTVRAQFGLTDVDPDLIQDLASASEEIETADFAAEVAEKFCP